MSGCTAIESTEFIIAHLTMNFTRTRPCWKSLHVTTRVGLACHTGQGNLVSSDRSTLSSVFAKKTPTYWYNIFDGHRPIGNFPVSRAGPVRVSNSNPSSNSLMPLYNKNRWILADPGSVLIPAIFWGGYTPSHESQIPPEKKTKTQKLKPCIKFTPPPPDICPQHRV